MIKIFIAIIFFLVFSSFQKEIGVIPAIDETTNSAEIELFENHIVELYQDFELDSVMDFKVFRYGLIGYYNMLEKGLLPRDSLITIIDFDQPSDNERLYILNVSNKTLLARSLVAHGKNTGDIEARYFSNKARSNQSCLGFFFTGETYDGKHKYSLKIDGVDTLYNHNARTRGVVFHGAEYVSKDYIEYNGRLGRSFGCPALPQATNKEIVDMIKGGSMLFIYASNEKYLNSSGYLNLEKAALIYSSN